MEIDEFFLDGAVKALDMGIHLWGTRIRVPMGHLRFTHVIGEVLGKLAAIIGEDCRTGDGKHRLGQLERRLGDLAITTGAGQGKGEARMGVG